MSNLEDIYSKLAEMVNEAAEGKTFHVEDVVVVSQDSTGIKKSDLLSIESDEEYVRNCFYKLMGRSPRDDEMVNFGGRVKRGEMPREAMIKTIVESNEYKQKMINARLV